MTLVPDYHQPKLPIIAPDGPDVVRKEFLTGQEAARVAHEERIDSIMLGVKNRKENPPKEQFNKPSCIWCGAWLRASEREAGIHDHCVEARDRAGSNQ